MAMRAAATLGRYIAIDEHGEIQKNFGAMAGIARGGRFRLPHHVMQLGERRVIMRLFADGRTADRLPMLTGQKQFLSFSPKNFVSESRHRSGAMMRHENHLVFNRDLL